MSPFMSSHSSPLIPLSFSRSTAGFYCGVVASQASGQTVLATTVTPVVCPVGYYCPSGSSSTTAAAKGFFVPTTGMSAPTLCTAASYCGATALAAVSGACSAGYYCPAGSSSATPFACAAGQFCPAGVSNYTVCPIGSFCPGATQSAATRCTGGYYCPAEGLGAVRPYF